MNQKSATRPDRSKLRLATARLLTTPLEARHLSAVNEWRNSKELNALLMIHHRTFSLADTTAWFEKNTADPNQLLFIVQDAAGKQELGLFRLMFIDWISGTAELAIFLAAEASRGQGLGKELLDRMVQFAFAEIGLRKLMLRVSSKNAAAVKAYEKAGFVKEGLQRKQFWNGAEFEDTIWMALFANE